MERVSFRAPKQLVDDIEWLVEHGYYANASEAWRDGGRKLREKHDDRLPVREGTKDAGPDDRRQPDLEDGDDDRRWDEDYDG